MSDVYYYGNQPMLKYKSGKKFGAVPIDKAAADLIESLQAEIERYRDALESIAANTCCNGCGEAAKVAAQALNGERQRSSD